MEINDKMNHISVLHCHIHLTSFVVAISALAITPSHHQNPHVFAHGRKNMNDILNNYVCSASHKRPELHFQNVWPVFSKNSIVHLYPTLRPNHCFQSWTTEVVSIADGPY